MDKDLSEGMDETLRAKLTADAVKRKATALRQETQTPFQVQQGYEQAMGYIEAKEMMRNPSNEVSVPAAILHGMKAIGASDMILKDQEYKEGLLVESRARHERDADKNKAERGRTTKKGD